MSQLQKLESKNLTWFPVSEKQPILDKIRESLDQMVLENLLLYDIS